MYIKNKNRVLRKFLTAALSIAAFFGAGCARIEQPANIQTPANQAETDAIPPAPPRTAVDSYSSVVKRVSPAVVTIQSERFKRQPRQFPFLDDERFREFYRRRYGADPPAQQPRGQVERGLGSGVVVSADGYVLTNFHVIDGAETIRVGFPDRQTFEAKVVGTDPLSDLAVLKIDANNLPTLALGNSDAVEVGDVVLAIGNPLGLEQSVTAGIISAKGRTTGVSDGSFEDFLQTDAPINRGNSGGALVNTAGEVIGINSQILSPTGVNIGIGFAIPSNMARNVMQQLIETGSVRRGQLGVVVQPVTSDIAQKLGLSETGGVLVSQVQPGSAAAQAGIREGDVIVAFNGEPVNESNELRNRVARTAPGTEVTLTVFRDGGEQQLRATLGELNIEGNE